MKKVIIIGSGGHAKVVIDILLEMKDVEIIGLTSNNLYAGTLFAGFKVIGDDKILTKYLNKDYLIAIGIGGYRNNNSREKIYKRIKQLGFQFINAIHPRAIISRTVILGEAIVIYPGVVVNSDVQIGNNTIIATGSTIDHETLVGNNVLISAGVTIGAYSIIEDNSLLALGSKIISGIKIGMNAIVAAGAVVVKDVLEYESVFGIPAKTKSNK